MWDDMISVNLSGVFCTVRAVLPSMIENGEGGSIILTSSTAGCAATQTSRTAGTVGGTPLASDEARYVTGVTLPFDASFLEKTGDPLDQLGRQSRPRMTSSLITRPAAPPAHG
jgi:hypothetical protein